MVKSVIMQRLYIAGKNLIHVLFFISGNMKVALKMLLVVLIFFSLRNPIRKKMMLVKERRQINVF